MNSVIITKEIENKDIIKNVFLSTKQVWKSTESSNLSVWESGEKQLLFKRIVDLIQGAKKMICLQSFLIQDTEIIDRLLEASKRGVKVYVMDSAEARLASKPFEEAEHYSVTEYKKMINTKFRQHFVHRQASNFHAKFILIDPTTRSAQGVLFTGNFNIKPFKENPELGVELNPSQVEALFQIFVYHFWEYATHEQTISEKFDKLKPANKFKKPVVQQLLITSPDKTLSNLKETLLEQIKKAKQTLFFSTFGFDINNAVSKAILAKLEEGVLVMVFCRPREKAIYGNIEILANKGARVFCHELIHAKSIVIDTQWGAIFSANFEKYGMDESFEVGIALNGTQKDDLLKIYQIWEKTFPYEFKGEEMYSNLPHNYAQLTQKELKPFVTLPSENQVASTKTIDTWKELVAFVEQEIKPKPARTRKIIQEKKAQFNSLKKRPFLQKKSLYKGLDLVSYEEVIKHKKTEKVITHEVLLLDKTILGQDLKTLVANLKSENLKNYKIYMN